MTHTFDTKSYTNLLVRYQPKPITTDAENDAAIALAEELDHRPDKTSEEHVFLELLVTLIRRFKDEHYPTPEVSPNRILRHLLESSGKTQTDLATIVGTSESEIATFVSGEKTMNEAQAAILAAHFKVEPSLFIQS
ncbi:MAG: transcriptional regulator [Cyanobacteria bacterium J06635_11]